MVLPGTTRPTRGKGVDLTHDRQRMRGWEVVKWGKKRVYVVYLDEPCIGRNRDGHIRATHPVFVDLFDIGSHATLLWVVLFGKGVLLPRFERRNCLWNFYYEMRLKIIYWESTFRVSKANYINYCIVLLYRLSEALLCGMIINKEGERWLEISWLPFHYHLIFSVINFLSCRGR